MKSIILAAGYATRMYPLTIDTPKPILKVGGKPMINYIVDNLKKIESIDQIYIVTNNKFFNHFQEWLKNYDNKINIKIINDGTTSNKNRLGAVGDIDFVIKKESIEDELLVIAGDNYFEFSIDELVKYGKEKKHSVIAVYDVADIEKAKKYGIVTLDLEKKIIGFEEKPANPSGTLAAICLYYFPKEKIPLITEYMNSEKKQDAPGYYITWLSKKDCVYAFDFNGIWYDIGDMDSYHNLDKYLLTN